MICSPFSWIALMSGFDLFLLGFFFFIFEKQSSQFLPSIQNLHDHVCPSGKINVMLSLIHVICQYN